MITFREIDKSNYMECISLKVKDEQRGFVADNARSLAEARFEEGLYTRGRLFRRRHGRICPV